MNLTRKGDENISLMPLGQVVGGIKDILTCSEVIEKTVTQAEALLRLSDIYFA